MRIPDKILARPAAEAGRQLVLEALGAVHGVLDQGPRQLDRALSELRAQLDIHEQRLGRTIRKGQRRLLRRAWGHCRELVQLKDAFEFGLSLEARRGFSDLHQLLRGEMRRRARRLRRGFEEEIRPALIDAIGELQDACGAEGEGATSGKGSPGAGEVLAEWLRTEARRLKRGLDRAELDRDRQLIKVERLTAALSPWSCHFAGAIPLLELLEPLRRRLARLREIELLAAVAAESVGAGLGERLRALAGEVAEPVLDLAFAGAAEELAVALEKGALSRLEAERLFVLRGLPSFATEAAISEVYIGWLPGGRVDETISRVYDGGAPRHARRVGLGHGPKRVEVEEETTESVFESLWGLTEGCRVRKRRYSWREPERRFEVEEFHDRDLVLARLVGRASAVAAELPAWLESSVLREVTDDGSYRGRRLGR